MKFLINVNFLKLLKIALTILCSVGIAISSGSEPLLKEKGFTMENTKVYLIDDFSKPNGISSLGTKWRMFTDRVMGGLSSASSGYEVIEGRRCLRLQGSVSLENNGGFVQVALPLELNGRFFDAGETGKITICISGQTKRLVPGNILGQNSQQAKIGKKPKSLSKISSLRTLTVN
jgi:hypothetical protein